MQNIQVGSASQNIHMSCACAECRLVDLKHSLLSLYHSEEQCFCSRVCRALLAHPLAGIRRIPQRFLFCTIAFRLQGRCRTNRNSSMSCAYTCRIQNLLRQIHAAIFDSGNTNPKASRHIHSCGPRCLPHLRVDSLCHSRHNGLCENVLVQDFDLR